MRTQFLYVGLLSAVAGFGLVGTAGCDDITAGQSTDSKAPPQLVHVLVQDARYVVAWPNRASSVDLLDNYQPPACTKQLDTCLNTFTIDFVAPDVTCTDQNVCGDPFKVPATGVPVPQTVALLTGATDMRDPGGGIQVRIVFDKVLDNSIEDVTQDTTKAPGSDKTYKLKPGIIDLVDSTGASVPSIMYYDNGGSPIYSSDLELVPLGPALVIKPKVVLEASSKYTVKILNPGALKDREGNAAVGVNGGALATSFDFTTEGVTAAGAGAFGASPLDYPAGIGGMMAGSIFPDEVVQFSYFENVAGDKTMVSVVSAPAGAKPIAFSDRGSDATMCTMADAGAILLDVVNSDTGMVTNGKPANWPEGSYDLKIAVPSLNGKSTDMEELTFTVAACKMDSDCANVALIDPKTPSTCMGGVCTNDANSSAAHLSPAQCTM